MPNLLESHPRPFLFAAKDQSLLATAECSPLRRFAELTELSPELPPELPQLIAEEFAEPSVETLVLAHMPQVRLVARSLWERTRFAVELDDLVGYGMLGLLDAIRKFDPTRGIMLKTYAEHRIRGAILDGLRGMDWLSRSARRQAKAQLEDQADNDGMKVCTLEKSTGSTDSATPAASARKLPPTLTALFCGGGVGEMERLHQNQRLPADWAHHQPTPERLLERKQERTALAEAVETLPERQRQVLDFYYRQELSMKQIAALLGVHESRVSQIHLAAIMRLRKSLNPDAPQAPKTALKMPLPSASPARDTAGQALGAAAVAAVAIAG